MPSVSTAAVVFLQQVVSEPWFGSSAPASVNNFLNLRSSSDPATCRRLLFTVSVIRLAAVFQKQKPKPGLNPRDFKYVKSRSGKQLRSPKNEDVTKPCEPEARNGNKPIVPCGLVSWSLFNDTYWFSLNNKA
ncbi:hypothetical protein M9H77_04425 [Catharanthus roseus]|uniref:Uncharacterized protein n=1 Tax=Catharanthus roseus TaxID=4058 RepID=A0ACC0CE14_CATRO|nr:hypothetical protein M9H77_04425 [Catharanthus roseus]